MCERTLPIDLPCFISAVYGAIKLEKSFEFDLVSIDYNGWVLLQASSLVAKITCEFNVQQFPFDEQKCNFSMAPMGPTGVYYLGKSNSLIINSDTLNFLK